MNQYNELGIDPYAQSRLRDTNDLTENERSIQNQFLSLVGLTVNRKGELVRETIIIDGQAYSAKPKISYEGAITLINGFLKPFLSNLASYTQLERRDVEQMTVSFGKELTLWLYSHRIQYGVDRRDIRMIVRNLTRQVFLQLSRSKNGELITQVMGNRSEQHVYQSRMDPDSDSGMPQQKRGWLSFGGIFGGR